MKKSNRTPNLGVNPPEADNSPFFNIKHIKMNHVNLIGKVSSAPRFYELPNGRKIAQFTMSTNETYLDENGETQKKNHWHRMSAWGRWVPVMQELGAIGMEIAVEGKLTTRFYQKGGEKRFISEVEVNDLVIL
jgi:single-strand DNA-binding protein